MDKRWVLTNSAGAFLRVLTPTGGGKFTEDRDLSNGCVGYRRKLADSLTFTGADYDYFLAIEKSATRRCEELFIRREWFCSGNWREFWEGSFSTGSGTWDRAHCSFTVKPEVIDRYSCVNKALNKKVNILQVAPVPATVIVIPSLEFGVCRSTFNLTYCTDFYGDPGFSDLRDEWTVANGQSGTYDCGTDSGGYSLSIFWRERETTTCVAGAPVSPAGSGWVLLEDNCATLGTATYVRETTIPWTFGDATMVENTTGIPTPPDDTCNWTYLGTIDIENTVNPFCPGLFQHWYICLAAGTATDLPRARPMMEALEYVLDRSGCPYSEVVSDVFEHNPVGDAPGYSAGINYVYGGANDYASMMILQNSDVIDPDATNPATLGEVTLKDLLLFFVKAFEVYWDLDEDGVFRLEHWTYWTFPTGLDVTALTAKEKTERQQYSHLSGEVPRFERMRFQQALGRDFVGADIEYEGPCVTTDEAVEVRDVNVGQFTSDVSFILTDPTAINKQGFTVLATAYNGAEYETIIGVGALSTNPISNAPLSVANLQDRFWRSNRYLLNGRMNEQDVEFDGILPNIEQKDVAVRMCCAMLTFDARKRVITTLGETLGDLTGYVQKTEWSERDNWLRLTLRYAY